MIESGIIVVNKAKDMTSHDCVGIVRRALKIKRVGHTGTLDPMATGVLPICVGKATKIADYISIGDKEYIAGFKLGEKTDTLDITGNVIKRSEINVGKDEFTEAVNSFKGVIKQVPPMYSAKKIKGKKLYQLAREGIEIEREPVIIEIPEIEVTKCDFENNEFEIRVVCSKGTYIRSLIDDLGEKLGCFAVMTSLTRTRSGMFSLSDSKVIDIMEVKKNGSAVMAKNFISVDKVFDEYRKLILPYNHEIRFKNGIRIVIKELGISGKEDEILRIYSTTGEFLALGTFVYDEADRLVLKSIKSFY